MVIPSMHNTFCKKLRSYHGCLEVAIITSDVFLLRGGLVGARGLLDVYDELSLGLVLVDGPCGEVHLLVSVYIERRRSPIVRPII